MNYDDILFLGLLIRYLSCAGAVAMFSASGLGSGKKQDGAVAGRNAIQAGCDEKGGAENCWVVSVKHTHFWEPKNVNEKLRPETPRVPSVDMHPKQF